MADNSDDSDPDRRGFLKVATCAMGAGVGVVMAGPVLKMVAAPADLETVTTPTDPLDLGSADQLRVGGKWKRYDVVAPVVSDAWTAARDVVLGSAFLRRTAPDKVEALSAVCPHLGCAVGYDTEADGFLCPCHNSRWDKDGKLEPNGKAKRALDSLPIEIQDGRLRLTWKLYKLDTDKQEPA